MTTPIFRSHRKRNREQLSFDPIQKTTPSLGIRFLYVLLILSLFGIFTPASLSAKEDWRNFYNALMLRGYSDVAVDYLESYRQSGNMPSDLKPELDRLLGLSSLELLRAASTKSERDLWTQRAKDYLTRFLNEYPNAPNTYNANGALGNIYFEAGNAEMTRLNQGVSDAEKKKINKSAQQNFLEAKTYIDRAVDQAKELARLYQKDNNLRNSDEANLLYAEYLDFRIKSVETIFQLALTFPEKSSERQQGLEEAKKGFDALFLKYIKYPGGYRARLQEAKVVEKMGNHQEALEYINEINDLEMSSGLYAIKTEALLFFAQLVEESKNPADWFAVLYLFTDWKYENELPSLYYITSEGLQIHLLAGQAALKLNELREKNKDEYQKAAKEYFTDGKKTTALKLMGKPEKNIYEWFDFVYKQRSPLSLQAEKFLSNPLFKDQAKETYADKPKDLESALQKLNRSWTDFTQANQEAQNAIGNETSAKAKAAKDEAARTAEQCLRWALEWTNRSTERDQVDNLRLQWATLQFLTDRYDEAEIIADYLFMRRQGYKNATKAAELSLHASRSAFLDAKKNGAGEEVLSQIDAKIQKKADFILKRWGNGFSGTLLPIVQEAVLVQMDTAVSSGQIDKAMEFLNTIPTDSPQRSAAEIQLGQSLWASYAEKLNALKAQGENISGEENDQLLSTAGEMLNKGLKGKIQATNGGRSDDYHSIYAALSLAQICVMRGEAEEGLRWLSHPNIGPLTLVEKKLNPSSDDQQSSTDSAQAGSSDDSAASQQADKNQDGTEANAADRPENNPNEASPNEVKEEKADSAPDSGSSGLNDQFQLSTLTVALQVLVAVNDFDRAEHIMTELESFVKDGKGDEQRLTAVYLQLGKQLQDQVQILREKSKTDASKAEELQTVLKGFEEFLSKISERNEGNTYFTLRWVGDTLYSLGLGWKSSAAPDEELAPEAKAYFEQSGRTYQTILKRINADSKWAPNENASISTTIRMVDCLREIGKYNTALKALIPLLKQKESNLDLQFAAAQIFQDWGKKNRVAYVRAIQGGIPKENGRNLVWGWNRIIAVLSRNIAKSQVFQDRFYEAVYKKMDCRLLWLAGSEGEERQKQGANGEQELRRLFKVHPDLGGPVNFKRLEEYLIRFETEAGNPSPTGFIQENEEKAEPNQTPTAAPSSDKANPPIQDNGAQENPQDNKDNDNNGNES